MYLSQNQAMDTEGYLTILINICGATAGRDTVISWPFLFWTREWFRR